MRNSMACSRSHLIFAICPSHWSWLRSRGWVKKGQCEAHTPVGPITRAVGVVLAADLKADRLFPDLQDLADLQDEGHGPFRVARGVVPVGRRFRAERESSMRLGRVCEEGLQEHLAKALSVLLDGDGPELVHQRANRPSSHLLQHDNRRPNGECPGTEKWVGSGRIEKDRADTPDQPEWSWPLGREKETLRSIAEPVL
jgi:hypothetical protein